MSFFGYERKQVELLFFMFFLIILNECARWVSQGCKVCRSAKSDIRLIAAFDD